MPHRINYYYLVRQVVFIGRINYYLVWRYINYRLHIDKLQTTY